MKKKLFSAMGLMSGTSMDGVDVSIIKSDGFDKIELILDKYFEYDTDLYKQLSTLRDKIKSSEDLTKYSKELSDLERALTIFHAEKISKIALKIVIALSKSPNSLEYFVNSSLLLILPLKDDNWL